MAELHELLPKHAVDFVVFELEIIKLILFAIKVLFSLSVVTQDLFLQLIIFDFKLATLIEHASEILLSFSMILHNFSLKFVTIRAIYNSLPLFIG